MLLRFLGGIVLASAAMAQVPPSSASTYRIAGTVVDQHTGRGIPMARLSLGTYILGTVKQERSILTGPDGRFSIDGLAAAAYSLAAESPGYPLQGFEQHFGYITGIIIGPRNSAEDILFRLHRYSVITGKIRDDFNEPVRNAEILVFLRNPATADEIRYITKVETDDEGSYRVKGSVDGMVYLAAFARPWYAHASVPPASEEVSREVINETNKLDVAYPLTFYPGVTSPLEAKPVTVHMGELTTADVTLHALKSASLRLEGTAAGAKLSEAKLMQSTFGDHEYQVSYNLSQLGNGRIEFTGVAPGRYVLHLPVNTPHGPADRTQELNVSGNTTLDADSVFASGYARITGTVELPGRKVPPSVRSVFIHGVHAEHLQVEYLGDDGSFKFDNLIPGKYVFYVMQNTGFFVSNIVASGALCDGHILTVGASDAPEVTVRIADGFGLITGFVRRDEKPVSGALIMLTPREGPDAARMRWDQSNNDGSFDLREIPPGKYLLYAVPDGWDMSVEVVLKEFRSTAKPVEVAPNAKLNIETSIH